MTQVTPIFSFPYPENVDAPDGPSQIHALALAVETSLNTTNGNVTGKQASDADLTALAALAGTGIAVRTAANTWAQRTLTSTGGSLTVTDAGGVATNPNLELTQNNGTATASGTNTMVVNLVRKYGANLVSADLRVTLGTAITVTPGTGSTTNTGICTLPVGFRPPNTVAWSGYQDTTSVAVCGVIQPTGVVEVRGTNPSSTLPIGTNIFVQAIFNIS